jgi:hypothetical protein
MLIHRCVGDPEITQLLGQGVQQHELPGSAGESG